MIVDISHVSVDTMNDVLDVSKSPVIFSHSNARAVTNHWRNVPDQVLRRVKEKRGVVMISMGSMFLVPPDECCNKTKGSIQDVVEHINHVRYFTGWLQVRSDQSL